MARAYAQMAERNEARKLYNKLLEQWLTVACSSKLDQIVFREANEYLKESQSGIMKKGTDHWLFFVVSNLFIVTCPIMFSRPSLNFF